MRCAEFVLIVLCCAPLFACGGTTPPPAEKAVVAPEPISPSGPTEIPFTFRWKPVQGDPIYRVQVTDAAERILFQHDVRTPHCNPTQTLKNMMADHATFTWTVSIVSADGTQILARSSPVTFSLK